MDTISFVEFVGAVSNRQQLAVTTPGYNILLPCIRHMLWRCRGANTMHHAELVDTPSTLAASAATLYQPWLRCSLLMFTVVKAARQIALLARGTHSPKDHLVGHGFTHGHGFSWTITSPLEFRFGALQLTWFASILLFDQCLISLPSRSMGFWPHYVICAVLGMIIWINVWIAPPPKRKTRKTRTCSQREIVCFLLLVDLRRVHMNHNH